jgi:hypothetical protein
MQMKEKICLTGLLLGTTHGCIITTKLCSEEALLQNKSEEGWLVGYREPYPTYLYLPHIFHDQDLHVE